MAECLDSVVNQTMQDIQIICVNDGSTDNSLAILQEYADRDSRIEIIDKPNGGLSSARNAAYPHIRGKYTLFVDSDDWIELDLCEKTYSKAEETGAQMTMFHFQHMRKNTSMKMPKGITPGEKTTIAEKEPLLKFAYVWSKLFRTDFLLEKELYFLEGLVYEDIPFHWKAVVLADRITLLPELLYHYRYHALSIVNRVGKHHFDGVSIYSQVERFLKKSGHYSLYKEEYHRRKLELFVGLYKNCPAEFQQEFRALILENLSEDDREFYRTAPKSLVPKHIKLFYEMIDGGFKEAVIYQVSLAMDSTIKFPERFLRHWLIKPLKRRLKAA